MTPPNKLRYVVSDLGFAYAVHDTLVRQDYEFEAGRGKEHRSSNVLNGRRVEICATRGEAQRLADRLNREDQERKRAG